MTTYPDWVEKQRRKGTNISCIRGKYYLYECTSKYDPAKKRSQKITTKYLGRITEEGLIPPKKEKEEIKSVSPKEYGASEAISQLGKDIYDKLKKHFPEDADMLFVMAIIRIMKKCPFKRIEEAYECSFLSEKFDKLSLSASSISRFLKEFGKDREKIVEFLKEFICKDDYILFDGTNIVSDSKEMNINRLGYNSHRQYDPQINIMMAFSSNNCSPSYYRIVPGNVRDVTAFKNSILESGISNVVVIADKGFGSKSNFDMLEESVLQYIVPLRRNNGIINKERLKTNNLNDFDGHFTYSDRVIFYYSYKCENKIINIYLDTALKTREMEDYVKRIEKGLEGYSEEGLLKKQYDFGTLALCTNVPDTPENIYGLYKTRGEIETSFDFLKNLLGQDKSYMHNEYYFEAWAFINHISLMLVYAIYNRLRQKKLLKKYSVQDFIEYLEYIKIIKINNAWYVGEITSKTRSLLEALDISIT